MKKVLLIIFTVLSLTSRAQVFMNIGAGPSFSSKIRPGAELKVGYNLNNYTITAGFHNNMTAEGPLLPQIYLGRIFQVTEDCDVEYNIGYGYVLFSMDGNKTQYSLENKWAWCFRMQLTKYIKDGAYFYVAFGKMDRFVPVHLGIKTTF